MDHHTKLGMLYLEEAIRLSQSKKSTTDEKQKARWVWQYEWVWLDMVYIFEKVWLGMSHLAGCGAFGWMWVGVVYLAECG